MHDQADRLRQLVRDAAQSTKAPTRPPLILVSGAQRGVGASTIALLLAQVLRAQKLQTLLMDASFRREGLIGRACSRLRETLVDVLAGGRTVSEALVSGPKRVPTLAGAELPRALADSMPTGWQHVMEQIAGLKPPADVIVCDGGDGVPPHIVPLWQMADVVLVITGVEPVSIMDAYATMKVAAARMQLPRMYASVNRATDADTAAAIIARLAGAAAHFLKLELHAAPAIPVWEELADGPAGCSRALKNPRLRQNLEALAECVSPRRAVRADKSAHAAA